MRAFTKDDTLISNNKNLFKDTTTLVKSHMKWVAFNFNYEYEDFLRVYPDSVFYKQVEKYIFKNYYASFTVGSFSRRKSDKKIEKLIKKDGANPIILEKELYTFYTLNAYIGNSYNGDELTEVDVDDLIIQNNNLDTIRSYYRKQKAFFGNYKEQTLVNLRADFTFVPHKQYKKDTNPEPSGSKGCVECCKDPEPKYNIAGNIYIREEIRNGEFKYTAFGIGVNLVENINKLFEDRKAAGNKISFLAGISFEFKVNNNQKYSDPIQTTPTFRTGFSF